MYYARGRLFNEKLGNHSTKSSIIDWMKAPYTDVCAEFPNEVLSGWAKTVVCWGIARPRYVLLASSPK